LWEARDAAPSRGRNERAHEIVASGPARGRGRAGGDEGACECALVRGHGRLSAYGVS